MLSSEVGRELGRERFHIGAKLANELTKICRMQNSVNGLATSSYFCVENHRNREPVHVGPPNARYCSISDVPKCKAVKQAL